MSDAQHEIIQMDIHDLMKQTKGDKTALGDAVQAKSFPSGTYTFICSPDYQISANMTADRNPGRPEVNFKFEQEEGRPYFLRVSPMQSIKYDEDGNIIFKLDDDGEPTDDPVVYSDAKHKNYSRLIMALGQQGEEYDLEDFFDGMVNTSFQFKLVEYVPDMKVGDIPVAKDRDYHLNQGKGELEEVFFRVKDDEELRGKIMSLGYDMRNYVESIRIS